MRMCRSRQRGVVAVIVVIAMFSILLVTGLALDASHAMHNKSRLQGVVDAAALSAAKVLDQSGDTDAATAAATAVFNANRAAFPALNAAGGVTFAVEYSNSVDPFAAGTAPANFVRVRAENFPTATSLSRLAGVNEVNVRGSAVAGPSPSIGTACNIAPVLVCGNPAAGAPSYGYQQGQLQILKSGSGGSSVVGPGNFQLIRLGGNGAAIVRENLAGSYQGCTNVGSIVETQPGVAAGPTAQGLNTRFGQYSGGGVNSTDYPPDVVTRMPSPNLTYHDGTNTIRQGGNVVTMASQIDYNYDSYIADVAAGNFNHDPAPAGIGAYGRREIAAPIADCSGVNTGQSAIPVLGFGCFFLVQDAIQTGGESIIYAQFLSNCAAGGVPGPAPGAGPGIHIIQLYKDSGSGDS